MIEDSDHIRTRKLDVRYDTYNIREVSSPKTFPVGRTFWNIVRVPSIIHAVAGTRTHQPVSHDLDSILWSMLYRTKRRSLRQLSGGMAGRLLSRGLGAHRALQIHNGGCCQIPMDRFVWDKRARLNPYAASDHCAFLAILELTASGGSCRAPGERPQVGSREPEINVRTLVQLLVGFIVDLLNVNPEVNNDRSWIRGMFPGRFTGRPRIPVFREPPVNLVSHRCGGCRKSLTGAVIHSPLHYRFAPTRLRPRSNDRASLSSPEYIAPTCRLPS